MKLLPIYLVIQNQRANIALVTFTTGPRINAYFVFAFCKETSEVRYRRLRQHTLL